jgi:hypothetical protein
MSTLAIVLIAIAVVNVLIVAVLTIRPRRPFLDDEGGPRARPVSTAGPDQPTMPLPRPDLLTQR